MRKEFPFLPKRKITQVAFIVAPSIIAITLTGVYGSSLSPVQARIESTKQLLNSSLREQAKLRGIKNRAVEARNYQVSSLELARKSQGILWSNYKKRIDEQHKDLAAHDSGLWKDHQDLVNTNNWYRGRRKEQDHCLVVLKYRRGAKECVNPLTRLFGPKYNIPPKAQ